MPVSAISGLSSLSNVTASQLVSAAQQSKSSSGADFSSLLSSAVSGVQTTESTANATAIKSVTGDLTDIHDATIAATRAQVTLELVSAVRNKGVEAFNEIMRMQA